MRGFFIDFEGIDGSGKGTLIKMLMDKLALILPAVGIVLGKEPGGTPLGREIRNILFHSIQTHNMAPSVVDCLFLADHIQNAETVVKPALAANKIVICDRYAFSQYAFATQREVNPHISKAYEEMLGPMPDLIFLLAGTPSTLVGRARGRAGEAHQGGKRWNDIDVQARIQEAYIRQLVPMPQTVYVNTEFMEPAEIFEYYIWPVVENLLAHGDLDTRPGVHPGRGLQDSGATLRG